MKTVKVRFGDLVLRLPAPSRKAPPRPTRPDCAVLATSFDAASRAPEYRQSVFIVGNDVLGFHVNLGGVR